MSDFDSFIEEARNLVKIDMSGAADGFAPIDPGTYDATVSEATVKPNNAGDGQNLVVVFSVDVDGKARKRTKWCPLQGRGAGITLSVVKALGVQVDSADPRFDPAELVGNACRLQIKATTRKDTGDASDEIAKVLPAKASVFQP